MPHPEAQAQQGRRWWRGLSWVEVDGTSGAGDAGMGAVGSAQTGAVGSLKTDPDVCSWLSS